MGHMQATGVVFTADTPEEYQTILSELPTANGIVNVQEDSANLKITFDIST